MKRWVQNVITCLFIGCFLFTATACGWGWNWQGPYHHAAIFAVPKKTVTVFEKKYSVFPGNDYNSHWLYTHSENSFEWKILSCGNHGSMSVYDIEAVNDDLYCSTWLGLFVYQGNDTDLQMVVDESGIYSIESRENSIFYILQTPTELLQIKEYNIQSKDIKTIATLSKNDRPMIVETDKGKLFLDEKNNIAFTDTYGEENRVVMDIRELPEERKKMSFIVNDSIAFLTVEEDKILFQNAGEIFEYALPSKSIEFYKQVKIQNNRMYFALKETAENSNCNHQDCICRYMRSWVMAFDFQKKTFSVISELGKNEQLISFSNDYVTYCTQDSVFRNGEKLYEFPMKIEPFGEYRIVKSSFDYAIGYVALLADDGKNWNAFMYDNHRWLKDEYA